MQLNSTYICLQHLCFAFTKNIKSLRRDVASFNRISDIFSKDNLQSDSFVLSTHPIPSGYKSRAWHFPFADREANWQKWNSVDFRNYSINRVAAMFDVLFKHNKIIDTDNLPWALQLHSALQREWCELYETHRHIECQTFVSSVRSFCLYFDGADKSKMNGT